jgi:hypothetical protein
MQDSVFFAIMMIGLSLCVYQEGVTSRQQQHKQLQNYCQQFIQVKVIAFNQTWRTVIRRKYGGTDCRQYHLCGDENEAIASFRAQYPTGCHSLQWNGYLMETEDDEDVQKQIASLPSVCHNKWLGLANVWEICDISWTRHYDIETVYGFHLDGQNYTTKKHNYNCQTKEDLQNQRTEILYVNKSNVNQRYDEHQFRYLYKSVLDTDDQCT